MTKKIDRKDSFRILICKKDKKTSLEEDFPKG